MKILLHGPPFAAMPICPSLIFQTQLRTCPFAERLKRARCLLILVAMTRWPRNTPGAARRRERSFLFDSVLLLLHA